MDDYPDVLDHLGRTPREVGAVHLYVEPVPRDADGYALATLWCQGAFEPMPQQNTVEVAGTSIALPSLSAGLVMRGRVPLSLPPDPEILFAVKSIKPPESKRVRPMWKIPGALEKLEDRHDEELSPAGSLLLDNAVSLAFGAVTIPLPGYTSEYDQRVKELERLRAIPRGYTAQIISGTPERISAAAWEEVWRPGQPLPQAVAAAPVVAAPERTNTAAPITGNRVCSSCGFSGKRADFGSDRRCPSCAYEWD